MSEISDKEAKTGAEQAHDHDTSHGHVHGPNCNHGHHHHHAVQPFVRATPKVGRNDACPCGSGAKYKKCCAANS